MRAPVDPYEDYPLGNFWTIQVTVDLLEVLSG